MNLTLLSQLLHLRDRCDGRETASEGVGGSGVDWGKSMSSRRESEIGCTRRSRGGVGREI